MGINKVFDKGITCPYQSFDNDDSKEEGKGVYERRMCERARNIFSVLTAPAQRMQVV